MILIAFVVLLTAIMVVGRSIRNRKILRSTAAPAVQFKQSSGDQIRALANGNIKALEILNSIINCGLNVSGISAKLTKLNLSGYQIVIAFIVANEDIDQLISLASFNSNRLKRLLLIAERENISQQSGLIFEDCERWKEYGFTTIHQFAISRNIAAIKAEMNWQIIYELVIDNSSLRRAIQDFLLPDKVNPAEWYFSLQCLKNADPSVIFREHVSSSINYILDNRPLLYPNWFLAGYPNEVLWTEKQLKYYHTDLKVVTLLQLKSELHRMQRNEKFSQVLLRMILNDYKAASQ